MNQQTFYKQIEDTMSELFRDVVEYAQFKFQKAANQLAGQLMQAVLDSSQNANKDTEEPKT